MIVSPIASKYVQTARYNVNPRRVIGGGFVRLVVIHTAECPERENAATNVMNYLKDPKSATGKKINASAHYCVDNASIICGCDEGHTAWHAGAVNEVSIGIEHAGYAKQNESDWSDKYSEGMLGLSAWLVADICDRWGIAKVKLSDSELRSGASGVVGHDQVSRVFGGTHWDPGPKFPWDSYMSMVQEVKTK